MSQLSKPSRPDEPFLKASPGVFCVSGLSASLVHTVHHPLYTLKNQMMYKGKNFNFREFIESAKTTRGKFLFRGVLPRIVGIAPEKALKMVAWDISLHLVDQSCPQCPQTLRWLIGGTAAGAATTIVGCPSERAMVLAHIQNKGFGDVLRSAGVKGLYHGAVVTLCRDIAFNQVMFVLRETILNCYEQHNGREPSPLMRVCLGLPASLSAAIIACPLDVLKTRVQGKELANISHKRPLQIMLSIARDEGPRYFFKGLLPRLITVPPYMAMFFVVNEELQKLILGKRVAK